MLKDSNNAVNVDCFVSGGSGWEALHRVPAPTAAAGPLPVPGHQWRHQRHSDPIPVRDSLEGL